MQERGALPGQTWNATRALLRQVNEGVALAVISPVLGLNAWRVTLPAERALLLGACLLTALTAVRLLGFPRRRPALATQDLLFSLMIVGGALASLIVNAAVARPGVPSAVLLLPLLAPSFYLRWAILYVERQGLVLAFSGSYLLLSTACLLVLYLRGHHDIDPLSVLLLGVLNIYQLGDIRRIAQRMNEEGARRREAERSALIDPLTGLHNRRAFDLGLDDLPPTGDHCLLIFDIDSFKRVNDEHGHDVGDQVLVALSSRVGALVHTHGELYRWGGEEFVVLLPDCTDIQAAEIAETIRCRVAQQPLAAVNLSVSLGVGVLDPALTRHENFRRIDGALRRAKDAGRNRVVCLRGASSEPGAGTD